MTEPEIQVVDEHGNPRDLSAVERAGVGYDPTTQYLDLNKDEKRRTTALMMAIQAYKNLLIPDAAYLREVADLARRDEGPKIQPATIDAMVDAAIKFDLFIAGAFEPEELTQEGRLEKFVQHGNGIALVPDRTSAPWWQWIAHRSEMLLFVTPKIRFVGPNGVPGASPAQGTTLCSLGERGNEALCGAASDLGFLVKGPHR